MIHLETLVLLLLFLSIVIGGIALVIAIRSMKYINLILSTLVKYPRIFERISRRIEAKKKIRKRYIVFEVLGQGNINMNELDNEIRKNIVALLGRKGIVEVGYKLVFYDESQRKGIIRSNNRAYKFLIGILGLVRKIGNKNILIVPISIHGTLKKAYEKIGE